AAQYAQGAAAWGIALHIDYDGDDTYDARLLSQAVGLPGGAGWLLNGTGNDSYYSKGERPTTYGNAGIFDSFSQAFGVGFRGMQSGGVALLYDGGGKDRYEAGNFSQGGGYYFGIGMLRDSGKENDIYIGSQYNQGFCLFLDLGGRNHFSYAMPQGFAGPNDYHGGTSFSLFITADDKGSSYSSKMRSSEIRLNGEYGIFANLPTPIEDTLKTKSWQKLTRK